MKDQKIGMKVVPTGIPKGKNDYYQVSLWNIKQVGKNNG
jgi:hypothetical protein